MILDGKKIAGEIKAELKEKIRERSKPLEIAIVQVGENEISERFIKRKQEFAADIGVGTEVFNLPFDISTDKLMEKITEICHDKKIGGVVVQIPLPEHINAQQIFDSIPLEKDIDVLSSRSFGEFVSGQAKAVPPIAGVIKTILEKFNINPEGKHVVVVGRSMLVGKSAAVWCINKGATVSVLNTKTPDISEFTKNADILITGTGHPDLITSKMVKKGAIIIDVGTGIKNGKLAGDVSPDVADDAFLFTPVPGGTGPITVAMIFVNLLILNPYRELR